MIKQTISVMHEKEAKLTQINSVSALHKVKSSRADVHLKMFLLKM